MASSQSCDCLPESGNYDAAGGSDGEPDLVSRGLMPQHLQAPVFEEDAHRRSVRLKAYRDAVSVGIAGVRMSTASYRPPSSRVADCGNHLVVDWTYSVAGRRASLRRSVGVRDIASLRAGIVAALVPISMPACS